MNRPSALSAAARDRFSKFLAVARRRRKWNQTEAAEAASELLPEHHAIPWTWVNSIEQRPAQPLANPVRLWALLRVYDLGWRDLLETLGLWDDQDPWSELFEET